MKFKQYNVKNERNAIRWMQCDEFNVMNRLNAMNAIYKEYNNESNILIQYNNAIYWMP